MTEHARRLGSRTAEEDAAVCVVAGLRDSWRARLAACAPWPTGDARADALAALLAEWGDDAAEKERVEGEWWRRHGWALTEVTDDMVGDLEDDAVARVLPESYLLLALHALVLIGRDPDPAGVLEVAGRAVAYRAGYSAGSEGSSAGPGYEAGWGPHRVKLKT